MSPDPVAPVAADAVIGAYYPSALQAAESARTRAQAAYTIASAVAAAIVAGGVFGNIDKEPGWVQWLGVATLCAWLIAAGLFIYAITASVEPPITGDQPDVNTFVHAALENVGNERKAVIDRQNSAYLVTAIAMVMTVALVISLLEAQPESAAVAGTLSLTGAGTTAVQSVCPSATAKVHGTFDPAKLGSTFVAITVDKGVCHATRTVNIHVPRAAVQAAMSDPSAK